MPACLAEGTPGSAGDGSLPETTKALIDFPFTAGATLTTWSQ